MAGPLKPVPDPEPDPDAPGGPEVSAVGSAPDAAVLAERRARRAELAEKELRERLAGAEERIAELELVAQESERARADLQARRRRDAEAAALVGEAAGAVAAARLAVDREIHARQAAEAALAAERIAREAAEQAVIAERAARDAATEALVAARVREIPAPAPLARPSEPVPGVDPALRGSASRPDDELAAGIAAAAERLRAGAAAGEQSPSGPGPQGAPGSRPAPVPGRRSGGLVGWLERRFGRPR